MTTKSNIQLVAISLITAQADESFHPVVSHGRGGKQITTGSCDVKVHPGALKQGHETVSVAIRGVVAPPALRGLMLYEQ